MLIPQWGGIGVFNGMSFQRLENQSWLPINVVKPVSFYACDHKLGDNVKGVAYTIQTGNMVKNVAL